MAKNQLYPESKHISVTATKAVKSGDPVHIGQIVGVAIIDAKQGEPVTVWLDGSWSLEVDKAVTQGALVYIKGDGTLTPDAAGAAPFGIALAAIAAKGRVEITPFGKLQTPAV